MTPNEQVMWAWNVDTYSMTPVITTVTASGYRPKPGWLVVRPGRREIDGVEGFVILVPPTNGQKFGIYQRHTRFFVQGFW